MVCVVKEVAITADEDIDLGGDGGRQHALVIGIPESHGVEVNRRRRSGGLRQDFMRGGELIR